MCVPWQSKVMFIFCPTSKSPHPLLGELLRFWARVVVTSQKSTQGGYWIVVRHIVRQFLQWSKVHRPECNPLSTLSWISFRASSVRKSSAFFPLPCRIKARTLSLMRTFAYCAFLESKAVISQSGSKSAVADSMGWLVRLLAFMGVRGLSPHGPRLSFSRLEQYN